MQDACKEICGDSTDETWFIGFKQFEMSIFDAAVHCNIGNLATLLIFDKMGIEKGFYSTNDCIEGNIQRINNAKRKDSEGVKIRRRMLRGMRKHKSDKNKKQEGSVYGPGKF